jgi:splicing factor 45
VERIRVVEDPTARKEEAVRVFVLFTSELSALRGVNALDGRLFGGRKYDSPLYCWFVC